MMKITGLSHLFKWENLHNWWLTKYFFAPLYTVHESFTRGSITCIYQINRVNYHFMLTLTVLKKLKLLNVIFILFK